MREYVLGVDGGGTKTHYALFDTAGNLVYFGRGGPANHEAYPDGYEGTRRELSESLAQLLDASGLAITQLRYSYLGLAGIDVPEQQHVLTQMLQQLGLQNFQVINDAFLGIKAGSPSGYGICSINGTGTCCAGIDPQGAHLQIGGTGYYFGDEGGARHLGGMVLRKVYDYLYRCGPPTLMQDLLFETLQITEAADLVPTLYQKNYYGHWAQFAKIPFSAANREDPVALALLRSIGAEAAKSVLGAIGKLDFAEVPEIDISMAGSVYVKGANPALIEAFQQLVQANLRQKARFTLLQTPPVAGAVLGALAAVERQITPQLRQRVFQQLSAQEHTP